MSRTNKVCVVVLAAAAVSCGLNVTGPFEGFDGQGTRLSGRFDSAGTSQAADVRAASGSADDVQGIRVYVRQQPSLSTTVSGDGAFSLVGLPASDWTIVFERDGRVIGEMTFRSVRSNQEIRIVVSLVAGEVVLLEEDRDRVSFDEDCPRGPGFWCQNKDGQNPNLSQEEFQRFAADAAALLASVESLNTADEVAAAVCDTGDQLRRHLATLALNLASGAVSRGAALTGQPFPTVGDAFDRAVQLAQQGARGGEAEQVKDVLDAINNGRALSGCDTGEEEEEEVPPSEPSSPPPTGGKITICHIPPGNPAARHTITISSSAWPAHKAHGDTMGACSGGR
ncbi:MAG TPA: carboxypeptidase-like regulatory domain-containing protein [Vicinamibacteria bacterium]|nr:carboxypeptidase-like regulatory domain-containing protein [Vicinamibacteria bacterium]